MSSRTRDPSMLVRLARIHVRLLISAAIGVAVTLASTTTDWRLATRVLTGWDVGVGFYLIATYLLVSRSTINEIRRRAAIHDEGAAALLVLTPAAAIASLAVIVVEFGSAESAAGWAELAFAMGTILLSWLFLHIVFALHYAHEYYGERSDDQIGGLKFPGQQSPDYWDFVYFSFVIAMTSEGIGRGNHQ